MTRHKSVFFATLLSLSLAGTAHASTNELAEGPAEADGGASVGGSVSFGGGDGASAEGDASADGDAAADGSGDAAAEGDKPKKSGGGAAAFFKKWRPEPMTLELGLFGGVMLPSDTHEIYRPDMSVAGFGHQPYASVAPDIGLRVGFYPLRFLGVEAEAAVMPTSVADGSSAILYGFRGYALAQLPYRLAPFALIGFGALGGSSDAIGSDIDPALHFGGGLKFYINKWLALRLDVRDNISAQYQVDNGRTHHVEILAGLSVTLLRKSKELIDSDGDGLYDPGQGLDVEDKCPQEPGPRSNDGCPVELIDSDGDGLYDPGQEGVAPEDEDQCPDEPGPRENHGCPLKDSDGDGMYDPGQDGAPADMVDKCPDKPGPKENDGCPLTDKDGDGFFDPGQKGIPEGKTDQCPEKPESNNGYQDNDGCPDEIPKTLKKFTGAIKGIYFDVNKDTIKPKSFKVLDNAVKVLKQFPDTRVEISGHTDSDGGHDYNVDLSQRRADSVKKYLQDKGIDGARMQTKGYGPDKPIADNKTKKGKAKNRRIEFKLLTGDFKK